MTKCRLRKICKTLYNNKCHKSYENNRDCILINNIKKGKVNNFVVSLIEKELNKSRIKSGKKYDFVECQGCHEEVYHVFDNSKEVKEE